MNDTNTITTIARIIFDGKDAAAFLQGQLSADVAGLANGKQTRAAYCNRQGRVVASMILYRTFEEQFVAVVCADVADELMMRLSRFILRAKVVMRIEDGGGLTDNANSNNWQRAEIVRGIPWIGKATMEMFLPQFINLDLLGGVSFRKGCYVGQEVIARLHYLGAVKRRAMIIRGSGKTPPEGAKITTADGANCGEVINAAEDGDGFVALAALVIAKTAGEVFYDGKALTITRPDYLTKESESAS